MMQTGFTLTISAGDITVILTLITTIGTIFKWVSRVDVAMEQFRNDLAEMKKAYDKEIVRIDAELIETRVWRHKEISPRVDDVKTRVTVLERLREVPRHERDAT